MFWGKWPSRLSVWVLTVLGAFATALPRIFPPLEKNAPDRWSISLEASGWVIGAGALAVVAGAVLKEVDTHVVKKGAAGVLERAANAVADLNKQLPRMMDAATTSVDRRGRVIEAAQNCALHLLRESGKNIRVTFYQLDYAETEQPKDTKPGDRPMEQARLLLVGQPLGRGDDPAREEFKYDEYGRATLEKILAKQEIWCGNAKRAARKANWPEPRYRVYISVPVIVDGKVEGMLSCDSLVRSELKRSIAALVKIPASFAGVELRTLESVSAPRRPGVSE